MLVVAGPVQAEQVIELAERYFGSVPARTTAWVPLAEAGPAVRRRLDRVDPLVKVPALALGWRMPPPGTAEQLAAIMLATVLGDGPTWALHRALVERGIATQVAAVAGLAGRVLETRDAEIFTVHAVHPADTSADSVIEEVLAALRRIAAGLDPITLSRALRRLESSWYAEIESDRRTVPANCRRGIALRGRRIGAGRPAAAGSGRAGRGESFGCGPARGATGAAACAAADSPACGHHHPCRGCRRGCPMSTLMQPSPPIPRPGAVPALTPPEVLDLTLASGLRVALARRATVPTVELRLRVPFAAAPGGDSLRTTASAAELLSASLLSGTESRDRQQINEAFADAGAQLRVTVDPQRLLVTGRTLAAGLGQALATLADCLVDARYAAEAVELDRRRLRERVRMTHAAPRHQASTALLAPMLRRAPDHPAGRRPGAAVRHRCGRADRAACRPARAAPVRCSRWWGICTPPRRPSWSNRCWPAGAEPVLLTA